MIFFLTNISELEFDKTFIYSRPAERSVFLRILIIFPVKNPEVMLSMHNEDIIND